MSTPRSTLLTVYLMDQLQRIQIANGYQTDIGLHIKRGRIAQLHKRGSVFAAGLHSVSDNRAGDDKRRYVRDYAIEVLIAADDGYDEQQDAILYDLRKALESINIVKSGGKLASVEIGDAELDDPGMDSKYAIVRLSISVTYVESY